MQVLRDELVGIPSFMNSQKFMVTVCTRGCKRGLVCFDVTSTKHKNKVQLCCSLENSDVVSSFIPLSVLFLYSD